MRFFHRNRKFSSPEMKREKREINRTVDTKSNEWVVSGYFVNVWEV